MPIAIRHRGDPEPQLPRLQGLTVQQETRADVMAGLQGRAESEIQERFDAGHRAYVASVSGTPAAWGWVATSSAKIGELNASFVVPGAERYLWNFVTLKTHRGLGIYPRLLDAIVLAESADAERFWVAYAPENHASGAGIRKAGFVNVAELSFDEQGAPAVKALIEHGDSASEFLGLPLVEEALAKCWKCARSLAPKKMTCRAGSCSCDYQRPEAPCA
jgi:GNAT superfamily N-acetyltransferase